MAHTVNEYFFIEKFWEFFSLLPMFIITRISKSTCTVFKNFLGSQPGISNTISILVYVLH